MLLVISSIALFLEYNPSKIYHAYLADSLGAGTGLSITPGIGAFFYYFFGFPGPALAIAGLVFMMMILLHVVYGRPRERGELDTDRSREEVIEEAVETISWCDIFRNRDVVLSLVGFNFTFI